MRLGQARADAGWPPIRISALRSPCWSDRAARSTTVRCGLGFGRCGGSSVGRASAPVRTPGSTATPLTSTPRSDTARSMNAPNWSSPTRPAIAVRRPSRAAAQAMIAPDPPIVSSASSTSVSACPNATCINASDRTRSGLTSPRTRRSRSRPVLSGSRCRWPRGTRAPLRARPQAGSRCPPAGRSRGAKHLPPRRDTEPESSAASPASGASWRSRLTDPWTITSSPSGSTTATSKPSDGIP